MTEDRRKKQREYARRVYQKQCEHLEKAFYKHHHITPQTNKEKVLKVVCKYWLLAFFEFGKTVGGGLQRRKHKKKAEMWNDFFKRRMTHPLTLDLKKAGVLPLPPYRKEKAV